ncbi:hypothetical protein RFI_02150, partial [Reticulomyxa filosa]
MDRNCSHLESTAAPSGLSSARAALSQNQVSATANEAKGLVSDKDKEVDLSKQKRSKKMAQLRQRSEKVLVFQLNPDSQSIGNFTKNHTEASVAAILTKTLTSSTSATSCDKDLAGCGRMPITNGNVEEKECAKKTAAQGNIPNSSSVIKLGPGFSRANPYPSTVPKANTNDNCSAASCCDEKSLQ